jgi:hypothetical protein
MSAPTVSWDPTRVCVVTSAVIAAKVIKSVVRFGYTLTTEQSGPKELVEYAVSAEHVGFDFEVCSDHFSPWLTTQGHAPNAWTTLGAVAHVTDRVELFTYVTCPTTRYRTCWSKPCSSSANSMAVNW